MTWLTGPALVVAVVALAACGAPTSERVEIADPQDVPFGLLEPDRVPVALQPGPGAVVRIHLFDPDRSALVAVTRQVARSGVDAIVRELEAEPTDAESSIGLRSALIDIDAVAAVDVEGSTAVVGLHESFTSLGGSEQVVAIAQLVYTLTARPDIEQVSVTIDGESVEVPRDDGTLTRNPLTRADYASFSPP